MSDRDAVDDDRRDRDDDDRPVPGRELGELRALSAMRLNYEEVDTRMSFDDLVRLIGGPAALTPCERN
jgi:hypothetical protein